MKMVLNESEIKEALNMYLAQRNLQVAGGRPQMTSDGDWGRSDTYCLTIDVEPKSSDDWGT